jgi:putative ABC transport system permease protein
MNDTGHNPPQFLLNFFRWYCDPEMHDYIEGDLLEVYRRRVKVRGRRIAGVRFAMDVLLLMRPGIIRSSGNQNINSYGMVRSYFKTGWRNLWRSKLYSSINIIGLTFGIVCFLLIGLYVFDELTYDRQHENAERIYRVVEHRSIKGEATTVAAAGFKLAEESPRSIPEVESATRLMRTGRANLVDPENPVPFQETVTIADEHFLEILNFPFIEGDRRTALKEPNSIIVDEDLAMRIFNSTNVMGRTLQFSHMTDMPLKITGILKKHPRNSSFTFNCVLSEATYYKLDFFKQTMASDWASDNFSIFALLRPGSNPDSVASKMTRLVVSNADLDEGVTVRYSLQPLTGMHLYSAGIVDGARNGNVDAIAQGNPMYITIFTFTAFFVLLIAGINYTNLTTARASNRVKEIGVRKSIGAMRSSLIGQFLVESVLTTVISFFVAVIIVALVLPMFNSFTGKGLTLGFISGYKYWLLAITFIILIGMLSGSYAALLLSGLKPVSLLKGLKVKHKGDLTVRKGLVILQFTISSVMIIGTILLLLQVRFLNNTELGFAKDLMVVIDVNVGAARSQFQTIKNEMEKVPAVKHVSVTSRVPGEWKNFRTVKVRNEGSAEEPMVSYLFGADKDFIATYEISLVNGRNFEGRSDSTAVIINETAARMLKIADAGGQSIDLSAVSGGGPFELLDTPFKPRVVGIVKDFHFQSLREKIGPLILAYNENPIQPIDYYSVKIEPGNVAETLAQLKTIMVKMDEREPFEYHFLDDQLALFYVEDERRQTLLTWVAIATIFIACLGLFGLATYSTEQRVKEIGVRKVLGASVPGLVTLLSKDFITLVLIANLIAFPIAWWGANQWLQEYAYHIDVSIWVFVVAALVATGIALMTTSYQAFKSARANPVDSLRSE